MPPGLIPDPILWMIAHTPHSVGSGIRNNERKNMSKVSPMSEEFHDWLDQCPVQWFRGEVTTDHVTYSFETPDEDEEKK